MTTDHGRILNEVKLIAEELIHHSEAADVSPFLACYADVPEFVAISGDGVIRGYIDFKLLSEEYYNALLQQKLTTTHQVFNVLCDNAVVLCWSGTIDAVFKNGDVWKMPQYTVTFLFRKTNGAWKVVHSHECGLPPVITKAN